MIELGSGTVPGPVAVTASALNAGTGQGLLAELSVTVDSIGAVVGGFVVHLHDDTDDAVVFVAESTGIEQSEFTLDAVHVIVGILAVDDANDDGDVDEGEYQLKPRDEADVQPAE